jgi:hypothetical protein
MHLTNANTSVFLTKKAFTSHLQMILFIKYNNLNIWHVSCICFGSNYDAVSNYSQQWNFRGSEMLKKMAMTLFLILAGVNVKASVITFETSITGADMVGIDVTATFFDTTTETVSWLSILTSPEMGGVVGDGWSLTQQGDTLGGNDINGFVLGAWSFQNLLGTVTSLKIDMTNTDFVFDIITFDDLADDTNGSGQGRGFLTDIGITAEGIYSNNVFDELFKTLEIINIDGSFDYLADTDKLTLVPEPLPMLILMSGLLGLVITRKKVAGK